MKGKQNVIRLSQTSVILAEVLRSSNEIISWKTAAFVGKRDIDVQSEFAAFLKENLPKTAAEETTLAWATPKSTLVPSQIFEVAGMKNYLHYVFGKQSIDSPVDYNRLSELDIVNVYAIPDWVKSAAILNIPTVIIQHDISYLLRGVFQGPTFKSQSYIVVYAEYFLLCLVKHNQLVFINHFDYQSVEDILYYFSYSLQQLSWMQEKMEIHLIYAFDETKEMIDQIIDFQTEKQLFPTMTWLRSQELLTLFPLKCV